MTASLIPNARQQFIDLNGNPLVGGYVYFYEKTPSLVPKNTWQDAAQTVLNENPVVLDSRGQATIYGAGAYRQVLTDADGNTIWDGDIEDYEATVFGAQGTITSNTTTNLGSVASNNILITGTTTINSFGTSASLGNPLYFIQFAGILTLTYNPTSMILPGAGNITTAAGDSALVEFTNTLGYWRMVAYFPASVSGVTGTAANYDIGTSGATVPLLNGANVWSGINRFQKQTYGDEVALTVTANASTPDFALANYFTATIAASYTLHNPLNVQPGQSGLFRIAQSSSSLTITWGTAYKSAGGIATVNLSGVSGIDYFAFYAHSSSEIVISPMLNVS